MTDDELVDRLRAIAVRVDPPPDFVAELARAALSTRRIDEVLAELVHDSTTELPALARSDDEQLRLLSFEHGAVSIELQVHTVDGTVSIRGLVDGATGDVTVETSRGSREAPVDEEGWFTVDGLATGVLRLRVPAGDTTVTTSWITP
ncbi:hypothetical protein [Plantactinospora endophytica]|uniref:Carboxypeptidase regulatory-like domain-containing protein n=1 Tax=Plantactinospora endophytica TaxID=673535 RepID=A0ABQ4E2R1_9ACTN|nr:hypothetical protein [Plantactinospora endophytica]GIG88637.1 hypothetical protein Pen02_35730 [Plantactinospora endophytica]